MKVCLLPFASVNLLVPRVPAEDTLISIRSNVKVGFTTSSDSSELQPVRKMIKRYMDIILFMVLYIKNRITEYRVINGGMTII
ncbi:hypothetical protein A163_14435 [Vibrio tasmaniensis 1F-267]|uniref:Uncharacterized protein n=1 Tax=Vibrio tasmaniensis 1F-267 TaxID=1191324 RepID=A0ABX3BCV9_9VIBR|nr:hypothetical protein A163_14435 [Vibrio tasmaniensis 1F-267]